MANPLTTARNKYSQNKKCSSIYTPKGICNFLFSILTPYVKDYLNLNGKRFIIDPAVGTGNLLEPFKRFDDLYNYGIKTIGFDIKDCPDRKYTDVFVKKDFLSNEISDHDVTVTYGKKVLFVICNPPFNNDTESKYNKKLLPELFAKEVFETYGYDTPLVLFAPMEFRLNNRKISKRLKYFSSNDCKAKITSIISLPLDIFPGVEFHNEILLWNFPKFYLEAHYWLPSIYLKGLE